MNTNELCNDDEINAGFSAHLSRFGVTVMKKNEKGNYEIFKDLEYGVTLADLHEMLEPYLNK